MSPRKVLKAVKDSRVTRPRVLEQKFSVPFRYSVTFTRDVFNPLNSAFADVFLHGGAETPCRVLFLVEKTLIKSFPLLVEEIVSYCRERSDVISLAAPPITVPGGESLKMPKAVVDICGKLAENNMCRHSFACMVGGGAFLDAAGFAASIVHRGIRQLRLPTTVLSQDDSGVGVKTAINMFGKKNFIGTFHPPFAVINDFDFLNSLSDRDWLAGIPEAFKVAIIKDADFFEWLVRNIDALKNRDEASMEQLVYRCAKLHLDHIATSGDPFEFGSARPLDFGHWAAHKIEMMSGSGLRHGEAVAIGIVLDSYQAWKRQLIDEKTFLRILESMKSLGVPLWHDSLLPEASGRLPIIDGIEDFREHLGGELHVTLPKGLGNKIEVSSIDSNTVREALDFLQSRFQNSV
ncbi:MAG: 3-dehydroquinate synthase [Victivallales bacterium]|nr:3-dehydroquinate synthase [Victivallales bacterium]